jgi:hypothetical protein
MAEATAEMTAEVTAAEAMAAEATAAKAMAEEAMAEEAMAEVAGERRRRRVRQRLCRGFPRRDTASH